jgi:hypothetical protein
LWVFGDFSPTLFRDSSYPWGCIGSIHNNEGLSGSGVLVGRNLVVTAGHLIPWSSGGNGWVQFTPADYLGTSLFGSTVTAYATDARGYDDGDTVAGYDWAILKLDQPLGDLAGYMGTTATTLTGKTSRVGPLSAIPAVLVPFGRTAFLSMTMMTTIMTARNWKRKTGTL